jgi:hypothetical protein
MEAGFDPTYIPLRIFLAAAAIMQESCRPAPLPPALYQGMASRER